MLILTEVIAAFRGRFGGGKSDAPLKLNQSLPILGCPAPAHPPHNAAYR